MGTFHSFYEEGSFRLFYDVDSIETKTGESSETMTRTRISEIVSAKLQTENSMGIITCSGFG